MALFLTQQTRRIRACLLGREGLEKGKERNGKANEGKGREGSETVDVEEGKRRRTASWMSLIIVGVGIVVMVVVLVVLVVRGSYRTRAGRHYHVYKGSLLLDLYYHQHHHHHYQGERRCGRCEDGRTSTTSTSTSCCNASSGTLSRDTGHTMVVLPVCMHA